MVSNKELETRTGLFEQSTVALQEATKKALELLQQSINSLPKSVATLHMRKTVAQTRKGCSVPIETPISVVDRARIPFPSFMGLNFRIGRLKLSNSSKLKEHHRNKGVACGCIPWKGKGFCGNDIIYKTLHINLKRGCRLFRTLN
jgi:hypothetical protein